MKRGYVDLPDGQIHYRTEGSGPPILFLHAAHSSSEAFEGLMFLLSSTHRTIAIDLPGHGDSDPCSLPYSIEEYGEAIVAIMAQMEIGKTSIFGFATGANIALEVAASAPERVEKVVIYNCPYFTDDSSRQQFLDDNPPKEIQWDGAHLEEKWQGTIKALGSAPIDDVQRNLIFRLQAQMSPKRGEEGHEAITRYNVAAKLPNVQSPTLVLSLPGTSGGRFQKYAEEISNAIPLGSHLVLPEEAHLYRKPWEFAAPVLDFLTQSAKA